MIALPKKTKKPKRPPQRRSRFSVRRTMNWFSRKRKEKKDQYSFSVSQRFGQMFDGIIGVFFPGWANRNIQARNEQVELAVKSQVYQEALSTGRFNSIARNDTYRQDRWEDSLLSPDAGLREDLYTDQVRAREIYRNNTIGHSAVEGRVSHEVGEGIFPQSQVSDFDGVVDKETAKRIRRLQERYFRLWSENGVDESRQHSFYAFQRQVCREFATMGEAFVLVGVGPVLDGPIALALQTISAERVETPPELESDDTCRLGVQYAKSFTEIPGADGQSEEWEARTVASKNVVTGYWVRTEHPGHDRQKEYKHKFYPRFDENGRPRMLHIFDPIHPEQSRGIPWLAAAANRMKDVDDFFEAELVAKQIEACFGIHLKTEDGSYDPHSMAESAGNGTYDDSGFQEEEMYPGFIHRGPEELKTVDPQRPGASFAPFIEAALRSIAAALNYPYELLAKNFFRTTFSSNKMAMLDGKRGFKMRQSVLIDMFCRPVWKLVLWHLVMTTPLIPEIDVFDYVNRKDLFEDQSWRNKPLGAIDEEKEVKARALGIKAGTTTLTQVANEDGGDFFEDEDIREDETKRQIERRLNCEKFEMDMRESLGLPEMTSPDEEEDESDDETTDTEAKDQAELAGAGAE